MNEEDARWDAAQNYVTKEFIKGEYDAKKHVPHVSGTKSYDAGYSFGIWSLEQKAGKHG